jgi:putative oxidoreductase
VTRGPEAWGPTLLRLVLGVIYIAHGWYAATVVGVQGMTAYMPRMGYPPAAAPWLAWYLLVAHLGGGLLLLLGLWTRVAALAQVPIMASATFLLHFPQGFMLKVQTIETPGGPRTIVAGYEYALLVLVATLALALTGAGRLSVDGWWAQRPRIEVP